MGDLIVKARQIRLGIYQCLPYADSFGWIRCLERAVQMRGGRGWYGDLRSQRGTTSLTCQGGLTHGLEDDIVSVASLKGPINVTRCVVRVVITHAAILELLNYQI
jgi:hypothetical protein